MSRATIEKDVRWISSILMISILPIMIMCTKRNSGPDLKIDSFNRDTYYSKTEEISRGEYHLIDSLMLVDDRTVICSAFKEYNVDNLSANFIVTVKDQRADSVQLNGILAFDGEGNPMKTMDSVLLKAVDDLLQISGKYTLEDGLYERRIQLEKFCR